MVEQAGISIADPYGGKSIRLKAECLWPKQSLQAAGAELSIVLKERAEFVRDNP